MTPSYPIDRPLPGHARPQTPDPADDRPVFEDRCERCYRGQHETCPTFRATGGVCCCEEDE